MGAVPWVGAHEDEVEGQAEGEAEGVGAGGGVAAPPVVLVAGRLAEGHDLAWRRGAARWQSLDAGGIALAIGAAATLCASGCNPLHLKQPYAPQAATLRIPGCNPMYPRHRARHRGAAALGRKPHGARI